MLCYHQIVTERLEIVSTFEREWNFRNKGLPYIKNFTNFNIANGNTYFSHHIGVPWTVWIFSSRFSIIW